MGIKISELPQASSLTDSDVIPIVQSGDTKKIAVNNIISNSHNTSQNTTYSSNYIDSNFNKVNVLNEQSSSTTDTYSANFINEKIPAVKTSRDTSTTDTYSCSYINGLFEYSTSEKRVGTWIDGKPLYQKTVTGGAIGAGSAVSVATGVTDIDEMVDFSRAYGYRIGAYGALPLNRAHNTSFNYQCSIHFNGSFYIETGSGFSVDKTIITFLYTKTSDTV